MGLNLPSQEDIFRITQSWTYNKSNVQIRFSGNFAGGGNNVGQIDNILVRGELNASCSPPPLQVIVIQKFVSNITLDGNPTGAFPGATIHYVIYYSNVSSITGMDVTIRDYIPSQVLFQTNLGANIGGWTNEYSTNPTPDQNWSSPDFTTNQPPKNLINWLRWRKGRIPPGEDGYRIEYKVIIK